MKTFNTIAIIGLGQIGASLAAALKLHHNKATILAYNRSPAPLKIAKRKQWVDETYDELGPWLARADLIIVCVPVKVIASLFSQLNLFCSKHALITDVGSTKSNIVKCASKYKLNFIGGHPMAGNEVAGIAGADAKLFMGKTWFLVKSQKNKSEYTLLAKLIGSLGAKVSYIDAQSHDAGVMWISHLPHVLAFNALHLVKQQANYFLQHIGSSFKSLTRVAASSPYMWVEIFIDNRKDIIAGIDALIRELIRFKNILKLQDSKSLEIFLKRNSTLANKMFKA